MPWRHFPLRIGCVLDKFALLGRHKEVLERVTIVLHLADQVFFLLFDSGSGTLDFFILLFKLVLKLSLEFLDAFRDSDVILF